MDCPFMETGVAPVMVQENPSMMLTEPAWNMTNAMVGKAILTVVVMRSCWKT